MKTRNTYWTMRHGESENNVLRISNTHDQNLYHLTQLGRLQSEAAAEHLKDEKIHIIYVSPFLRTRETAEIVATTLEVQVMVDVRIAELDESHGDGPVVTSSTMAEWNLEHESDGSYRALYERCKDFIDALEGVYEGKAILLITHATPQNMLEAVLETDGEAEALETFLSVQTSETPFKKNAEVYEIENKQ